MLLAVARRTAIPAAVAAMALLASAACSSGGGSKGSAGAGATVTVATEVPRTTTTNPYAVPAVIDIAYVNRVLAGLDAAMGDALRLVVSTRTVPREAYDRLRAMYATDDSLQLAIDLFQSAIRKNFAGYNAEPGNQLSTVSELLTNRNECIFARVRRDYSAIGPGATATSDKNWVALRRLDGSRDPSGYNRVGWAFAYEGFAPNRTQPADPCAS